MAAAVLVVVVLVREVVGVLSWQPSADDAVDGMGAGGWGGLLISGETDETRPGAPRANPEWKS